MTLKELLTKWNSGILRGAQRKFAARIGVKEATVSHWARGNFTPDENLRAKIARELGVKQDDLMSCFAAKNRHSYCGDGGAGWNPRFHTIPVVGIADGEHFIFRPDATPEELLPLMYNTEQKVIALKLSGPTKITAARNMDYAVISMQNYAEAGQLTLASEDGKYFFKYLAKGDDHKIAGVVRYFFKKP